MKFYNRGNQYWKLTDDGKALLINLKEKGHHYDGDAHIFMKTEQFYQGGSTEITEAEFNAVRKKHLDRLRKF